MLDMIPPQLWHVSEEENRGSIANHGLLPAENINSPGQPVGVYAWRARTATEAMESFENQYAEPGVRYDIWLIDESRCDVDAVDDPAWSGEAVVLLGPVPPDALKVALTFVST